MKIIPPIALLLALGSLAIAQEFEEPPVVRASDLLKPEYVSGDRFKVAELVPTRGFLNEYIVVSDYGTFRAQGNMMLIKRLNEIRAITQVRKISESEKHRKAVGNAIKQPIGYGLDFIDNPLKTTAKTVGGVGGYVRRATESVRRVGKKSEYEERALAKATGIERNMRQIAGKLRVDPYTNNAVLIQELHHLAWLSWSTKVGVIAGLAPIGGGMTPIAVVGGDVAALIHNNVTDLAPVEVHRHCRETLSKMGVHENDWKAFLGNSALTPTNQLVIVEALKSLGGARGAGHLIRAAAIAKSEGDASYCETTAALMARYNKRTEPITDILAVNGLPVCFTKSNKLVIPLNVDYGSWNEQSASLAKLLAEYDAGGLKPQGRVLYITGKLSELATKNLTELGFEIVDGAFGSIYK